MTKAQYITDKEGKRISVIISMQEYETMLTAMEELEDIIAYDSEKSSPQEYIGLGKAFELIEQKRKENALSSSH